MIVSVSSILRLVWQLRCWASLQIDSVLDHNLCIMLILSLLQLSIVFTAIVLPFKGQLNLLHLLTWYFVTQGIKINGSQLQV